MGTDTLFPQTVLVVGGIGYIGSHAVRELVDTEKGQKYQVVVVDNQSTGHPASLPANVAYEKADLRDKASLDVVFKKHHIDAVMVHLVFSCLVVKAN